MSYFEDILRKMTQQKSTTPTKKTPKQTVTKKKKDEEEESLIEEFVRETYGKLKTFGEANSKDGKSTVFTNEGGGGRSFADSGKALLDEGKTILDSAKSTTHTSSSGRVHGGSSEKLAPEKNREFLGLDIFQKGAFEGYKPGEITDYHSFEKERLEATQRGVKALLGTIGDVGLDAVEGGLGLVEGVVDLGAYGTSWIADVLGFDGASDSIKKAAQKDSIADTFEPADKWLEQYSVLGDTSDSVSQMGGQALATMGVGALAKVAGAAPKAVSFITKLFQGSSAFGRGMSDAYKDGATDGEAVAYGAIASAAEVFFESLFSGMGKTAKGVGFDDISLTNGFDDFVASKFGSIFKNETTKNLVEWFVKSNFNGLEEWFTGIAQGTAKLIYEDEKTWKELMKDEGLWEQYFVGMLGGGIMMGKDLHDANKSGRDFATGLNADETTVVNKIAEERVNQKAKKDGKEVSKRDKAKIRDEVLEDLENGELDVGDVERILGGDSYNEFQEAVDGFNGNETYKAYRDALAEEKALQEEFDELSKVKTTDADLGQNARFTELQQKLEEMKTNSKSKDLRNQLQPEIDRINKIKAKLRSETMKRFRDEKGKINSKLAESYLEDMRSYEAFKADVSKYKGEHSKQTVQNILDSGLMDNSNKMHRFVDFLAKISDARGVTFSLTDAKKLAGTIHDLKNAVTNGFVNGNEITLNMDSKNARKTVVGHEISHVLEESELYDTLANSVMRYAVSKGEWDTRLAKIEKLYAENGIKADPKKELVADLVGEYIFTDRNFVSNLSTDKNVFKRVWDEIKWLARIATAGSEEARNLEEAKRIFEMVWRESGMANTKGDVKHSLTMVEDVQPKSDKWHRTHTTDEVKSQFPELWDIVAEESETRNPTQIAGTVKSYRKVYDFLKSEGFNGTILDASSGMGYGTKAGIEEYGFDVEDIEPYPDQSYSPKYKDYSTLDKKYDVIISNAVLNVLPQEQRDALVVKMGEMLNDGGRIFVNVRGTDVKSASSKVAMDESAMEYYIADKGTYQKGFKKAELVAYLEDALGDGFTVKPTNMFGAVSAVVTKNGDVQYSLSDSNGNQLTDAQSEFFKDSVVRDENGNLKVMYHGTSQGGHTVFDPYGSNYGLFGAGSYFTDSKTVAESYTSKGKGTNPQVYESYLNITNPMDMDANANPAEWQKAFPEASFPRSGTNEDFYRAMEEYFEDNEYASWEAKEAAMEAMESMGYDGITHIGGGRVDPNGERHRVYIAFNPEQIKNTDNVNPTSDPDIRYSITEDSDGGKLTDGQKEFFKDSKAVDRNGKLLKVYHTTKNNFTVFDDARKGEATDASNTYMGHFFTNDPEYMGNFPEFEGGKTDAYYLNMKNPIDMNNISRQAFLDIVEVTGGDVAEAAELYDREYEAEAQRAKFRGDSNTFPDFYNLIEELTGEFYDDAEFHKVLQPNYGKLLDKGYDGFINNMDGAGWADEYIVIDSNQAKLTTNTNPTADADVRYSLSDAEVQETNDVLKDIGVELDGNSGTVSYSISSLEDAFGIKKGGLLDDYTSGEDYLRAREEYVDALMKATGRTKEECDRYLDSLFLVGEMIANDKDRLDYEAAVNKSAWVSNAEYGGSIDFSTLCAKRRLFTGTFDAIQEALPDTVLNENDFLRIRNMLLAKELESPCSMCYVEGSRAKHGEYVAKFLKDYLATNPEWRPQIADFTSTTMLEQTRLNHPEAYKAYQDAMNKLAQRKPKEASVRTDYKGEILVAFEDGSSVEVKNENGGVRFNSFSDFEIIHALDCMQVLTDMARVGLNGQAYTKVAAFAEAFGNTGLKINLSLVAKDVDANGKLVYDEVNGMKSGEAFDIRNRYSDNVGTVIVVFNEAQLRAALADGNIDYVLPFHRSQWKKSQYTMMGLPVNTRDFTNLQNDRVKNPKTGRPVKLSKIKHTAQYVNDLTGKSYEIGDNIMPNQYWDYTKSGRENAQRYLDYINSNNLIPKFNFLLENVNGKWTLPADAVGDGYFKLLIDFKMYNNDGVGSPQRPVVPEFNMPYITDMLEQYKGGHKSFPVAHDVVNEFVEGKKKKQFSITANDAVQDAGKDSLASGKVRTPDEFGFNPFGEDIAPVAQTVTNGTENAIDVRNADSLMTTEPPTAEFNAPVTNPAERTFVPPTNSLPTTEDNSFTAPVQQTQYADEAPIMDDGYMDSLVASEPPPAMFDAPVRNTDDQQTPQILTEEKPKVKKKNNTLNKLVELFVDKGAVFERLSKKTKNRELEAKYNFMHYSEAKAQKFIGKGDADNGIRSLTSIAEQVGERTKDFYTYLYHILNMDRMTLEQRGFGRNKAVFGSNVTAQMSGAIAQRIEAQNPDFRQLATEIYGINQYLRQKLVDSGIITQDVANRWAQMYPHYVPISRADHEALAVEVQQDSNKTGVNAPVKRATGGDGNILPLFNVMGSRILQTFKAVDKNSFGLELMRTLGTVSENSATDMDGIMDAIDTHENLLQVGEDGTPTFSVFANGQRMKFNIDKEMYDALSPTNEFFAGTSKVLNTISNIRRGLITEYNPTFLVTNAYKDAQDVLINSRHPFETYADMPRALVQIIGNGEFNQEYMANGGEQLTYFEKDTKTFKGEKSTFRKVVGFPLDVIAYANHVIERVPRLAEYIASREHGASIEVAMLDAARVTTNFAAGGDVTKWANRNGFTFLNASVQGAAQQIRNIQEAKMEGAKGWLKLAGKTVLAGLPALLLNGLLWDDDEEYEELSDYVKENYYIVGKFGDGQFIRIPKGRTVAVIQEGFEQMKNLVTGDDEVDFMKWANLLVRNLAPNDPLNNFVLSPIIQAYTNKAWHGGEIVPEGMQKLPTEEQYDESTDSLSKWLGENFDPFGFGAKKINYMLDQYTGAVGDVALPMMTPKAERGDDSIGGQIMAPWVDKFTTDSVINNQNVPDFYDLKDELTINANSIHATDDDILKSKYMSAISAELNQLYKEKREIQNSNLPNSEKFEKVRELQEQINEGMKSAMSTYEDITYETDVKTKGKYAVVGDRIFKQNKEGEWVTLDKDETTKYKITSSVGDANYATDGENHYRWYVPGKDSDEEPSWRKVTEKELKKQNDVTRKLGITPEEYWSNRDEESTKKYNWVYENPNKYTVASAVTENFDDYWEYKTYIDDIDAKDENGKTVSGLAKRRTEEYINSLDIDYGQKMILFRDYYPKDDKYCADIVDYLNSRDDISYFEMVGILNELDMKVSADGTVTWD